MRRLAALMLVPTAMVAVLLAGCGDSGIPDAAGPAASPPKSLPANTRDACTALDKAISDGAAAFGNDLGNLVGFLASNDSTRVSRTKADAITQLNTLVANLQAAAQPATDPALVAAAKQVEQTITAMASDTNLLDNVRGASDLGPILDRLTHSTDPITTICN